MKPTAAEVEAGQAVYTKRVLSAYDLTVLGISNRYIWKCPTRLLQAHYNNNVSSNHLDVGVGTGYFLFTACPGQLKKRQLRWITSGK